MINVSDLVIYFRGPKYVWEACPNGTILRSLSSRSASGSSSEVGPVQGGMLIKMNSAELPLSDS